MKAQVSYSLKDNSGLACRCLRTLINVSNLALAASLIFLIIARRQKKILLVITSFWIRFFDALTFLLTCAFVFLKRLKAVFIPFKYSYT